MFCSQCRKVGEVCETTRRICKVGHLVCPDCDSDSEKCQLCSEKFSKHLRIQVAENVPRMFITDIEEDLEELLDESKGSHDSFDTESMQEVLAELKAYEDKQEAGETSNQLKAFSPIVQCFEVLQKSAPVSRNSDRGEKQEILKYFEICEKTLKQCVETMEDQKREYLKNVPAPSKIPIPTKLNADTAVSKHSQEVQTSEPDMSGSQVESERLSQVSSPIQCCSQLSMSSHDCYPSETFDEQSTGLESAMEIFVNKQKFEESDTAHYTSITVTSTAGSTPIHSPLKKKIPSIAHRVRHESFYHLEGKAPAQMEPIQLFEVLASEVEDKGSSIKLSRYPVLCPITDCNCCTVPSDFCNHIIFDHPYIEVMKTEPSNLVNLKIGHKRNSNMVTCLRMFLVGGKNKNVGYGSFEGFLPVLLLATKMSPCRAFGIQSAPKPKDENFYIFFVGVYDSPLSYTITVWSHGDGFDKPSMIKSMSNNVKLINKPMTPKQIAANAFSLSPLELQKLTSFGDSMISCQVVFH